MPLGPKTALSASRSSSKVTTVTCFGVLFSWFPAKRIAGLLSRMRIGHEEGSGRPATLMYLSRHPSFMYSMLYMTAEDKEAARRLVKHLVEARLVACGNIFPIHSIYRWKGKLEEASEVAVIMKTKGALVERAIEEVHRLHAYEVPCVVSYAMERGLPRYLGWIEESTS